MEEGIMYSRTDRNMNFFVLEMWYLKHYHQRNISLKHHSYNNTGGSLSNLLNQAPSNLTTLANLT